MSSSLSLSPKPRRTWLRWLKRLLLGILALLLLLLVVGSTYEFISRREAASLYPPPGKLVDIGGRNMQIDCRGNGSPTVVFEAGLDMNGSLAWAAVHDQVAQLTRACAYSRSGAMWSEPHAGPTNANTVTADLHATLAAAGEQPPFVLVGHSLGGPYIMNYTRQHGDQVAGLVFVDASHPDQLEAFKKFQSADSAEAQQAQTRMMKLAGSLAWTGLPRLAIAKMTDAGPEQSPTPVELEVRKKSLAYGPSSIEEAGKEMTALPEIFAEAGKLRQLGNRPLVVLTGMKPYPESLRKALGMTQEQADQQRATWLELHNDEASWSSNSRHEIVNDAGHYIQFDRPDVVIDSVRWVVEQVRAAAPPPVRTPPRFATPTTQDTR